MTVSLRDREARAILDLLALPGDDWKPEDWAVCDVARDHLQDLKRRIERSNEARADWEEARKSPLNPRVRAPKRKPDPPELVRGKAEVRTRSGGYCELRLTGCERQQMSTHHRGGRVGKGCHASLMLLGLCGVDNHTGCHGAIHQNPDWAKRHGLLYVPVGHPYPPTLDCPIWCPVDHRPTAEPR